MFLAGLGPLLIGVALIASGDPVHVPDPGAPMGRPGSRRPGSMGTRLIAETTYGAIGPGIVLAFVFAAVRRSHELITTSIAFTVLGVAWMGLGFSHAVLLRDLPTHGAALLIDVLVATFLSDTAAYAAGRLFGTRKITPRISPNKTLEGLFGGFVGATLGFWFAGLYQDWLPGIDALVMGMCIAVVAPIGDLFASMLKRDLGVKDTGRLFGPHGGLIDRLDAVIFTVVAGYYLSVAFIY